LLEWSTALYGENVAILPASNSRTIWSSGTRNTNGRIENGSSKRKPTASNQNPAA
jgi:hypothetical protein